MQLENVESVLSGLILTWRIRTGVVSQLIDTDGYRGCIWIDTDLRKLIGVRHSLQHIQKKLKHFMKFIPFFRR